MAITIYKADAIKDNGVKILLYAPSGTGKTTLAGSLPGKTLLLNAENGVAVLRDKANIDVVDTPNEATVIEVYQAIVSGELKYDNIVLDSISEIAESMALVLKADPYYGDAKNSFKYWEELKRKIIVMMKAFRDLKNVNVVFCALESEVEQNAIQVLHPMVPGKGTMKILPSIFDEVLRLETDLDGKRLIRTNTCNEFVAKSRYNVQDKTDICDLGKLYKDHLYSSTITQGE